MQAEINRIEFLDKLSILEKAYTPKNNIQSLTFLKFDNGKLTMSDNNTIIITRLPSFENEIEFKTLLPFKTLKDILSKLNENYINLELKDNIVVLKCGKSTFKLNTMEFNEYPNINIQKLENTLKINSREFKDMISNVVFSCSKNDKRPILTGVNFNLKDNELTCVATDNFRLSQYKIRDIENNDEMNLTIQGRDLNNLLKLIPNDIELEIRYDNNNNITFKFNDILYKCRLLEGNYPNIDRIIPITFENIIKLNVNDLKECVDRASIFKDNESDIVTFEFNKNNDNELIITSKNNEIGNAKEIVTLDNKIDFDLKISCSIRYLLEALNVYNGNVNISFNGNMKPFTITSENDNNMVQLLLPVKVE